MSPLLAKEEWIRGQCTPPETLDNLKRYHLVTNQESKDEENMVQVLSIGPVCDKPSKSIFLIGETGAGKTLLINAFINHLFGIEFDDTFRVFIKDQISGAAKEATASQTDYITVYKVYHQEEMRYDFNFIVIDTPGVGDTRGKDHQKQCMKRLNEFFRKDFGVDELNCLGIVIKSNVNRQTTHEKQILKEVTSILGNECEQITQILCTFGSDQASAVKVVEECGIKFSNQYKFDNYPLICSNSTESEVDMDSELMKFRWLYMSSQHSKFFEGLQKSKAINVKRIRTLHRNRKKLHKLIENLDKHVKSLSSLHSNIESMTKSKENIILAAQTIKWKDVIIKEKTTIRMLNDKCQHAHNCKQCQKTCLTCPDPSNVRANIVGAAGAGGVAAAAGVGLSTPALVSMAIMASVTIPLTLGVAAGFGYVIARAVQKKKTDCTAAKEKCMADGCSHEVADHEICDEEIIVEVSEDERIDKAQQVKYDQLMMKVVSLKTKIVQEDDSLKILWGETKSLITDLNRITEEINKLTFRPEVLDPIEMINKMIPVNDDAYQLEVLKWVKNEIAQDKRTSNAAPVNHKLLDNILDTF